MHLYPLKNSSQLSFFNKLLRSFPITKMNHMGGIKSTTMKVLLKSKKHYSWIDESYSVNVSMRILLLFITIFVLTNSLPKFTDF
jgi:hypothetical protein